MAVKIRIPAPLRKITKDQAVVESKGSTIDEVISDLEKNYPGIKERICDETGQVRRFINVFVNGEDIRFKEGLKTKVSGDTEVSIIPAIAGGSLGRQFFKAAQRFRLTMGSVNEKSPIDVFQNICLAPRKQ